MPTTLDSLQCSVQAHAWERSATYAFALLFPLPENAGTDIARDAVARHAAFFRRQAPSLTWPEEILADPIGWARDHGRSTGETPPDVGVALGSWLLCLDALLLAVVEASNVVSRTAAWATAIYGAVTSRALAVWEADDPEAVDLWRTQSLSPDRTHTANPSSRAALEREWSWVVRRLAVETALHPSPQVPEDELEAAIQLWKANEYTLILPHVP
jgi:hypothetical protein